MCEQQYNDTVLMRRAQIEYEVSEGDHDAEYADFILREASADGVPIGNGDVLTDLMECGRYFDGFCDYLESKK